MGESSIERTTIALLLMLLATLGSRQWFRVELAAASVAERKETPLQQASPAEKKGRGFDLPMEGEARLAALRHLRQLKASRSTT
jgi:hypothetical protein